MGRVTLKDDLASLRVLDFGGLLESCLMRDSKSFRPRTNFHASKFGTGCGSLGFERSRESSRRFSTADWPHRHRTLSYWGVIVQNDSGSRSYRLPRT